MPLRDIKGQPKAVAFLKNAVANKTVAQSYMFAGPDGTGRFLTALEFARTLVCAARIDNDACGECAPCKKFASGDHPDLVIVKPDAAPSGEVKIDMVRSMRYLVNLKPYEMPRQVCVIDSADRMNAQAANAILKVLEEPPEGSVLILIVENPANLPLTISSRCRTVRFFPMPAGRLEKILKEEHGEPEEEARYTARFSSGSMGRALRFKSEGLFARKNRVIDGLSSGAIFDEEAFGVSKEEMPFLLDIMLSWYRDVLMAKVGAGEGRSGYINIDRSEAILKEARDDRLDADNIIRLTNEIAKCRSCLEYNVNFKLAWSVLAQKVLLARKGDLNV